MATIVNSPPREESGMGFFLGLILMLIFAVLFFVYIIPVVSRSVGVPQITVPGRVDVNVNRGQ